jgi:hypothetical protein
MTVTLDLPPDLESHIRDRATAAGVDLSTLAIQMLRAGAGLESTPAAVSEAELLRRIDLGLTPEFWDRFRHLTDRMEDGVMTEAERDEYLPMTDRLEETNARRLEAVVALSRLRGVSFDTLMDDLGLRPKADRG